MLEPVTAHLICIGLVAADYGARNLRIQLLARGVGARLSTADAMAVNAVGDAACALTPLRIAGEPARLGVMFKSGVPATGALVAITLEVLAAWPVILVAAGLLAAAHAAAWWSQAGPGLAAALLQAWPWVAGILLLMALVWVWIRRRMPAAATHLNRPLRRMRVHWRRMPWSVLLATTPLTLVNLATRVAVLPVLAATLPDPPALGPLLVGSFALLYSQLILPTPSGAGAVELGFLSGAAGNLGTGEGALLLAWRFYTTGIGILLGVAIGLHRFGWRALRGWLRPRAGGD